MIHDLENVRDGEEARKAEIREKTKLKELELVWGQQGACSENDKQVLEGLQPHPNLKILIIKHYRGDGFPSWVMKMHNLVEIRLWDCKECEQVPMLGHLPCLQYLAIEKFEKMKCNRGVSDEFDGSTRIAFPSLKYMYLGNMPRLVEWKELGADNDGDEQQNVACTSTRLVRAFPCLEVLTLHNCPKLKTFTNHNTDFSISEEVENRGHQKWRTAWEILHKGTSLEGLSIVDVEKGLKSVALAEMCENNKNLTYVYIKNIGELESMDDSNSSCHGSGSSSSSVAASQSSKALRSLEVSDCQKLRYMDVQSLTGLEGLNIRNCNSLEYITRSNSLEGLTSLKSLVIGRCSECEQVPMLSHLPCLEVLEIYELEKVKCIGAESDEFYGSTRIAFPSLKELYLRDMGGLVEWKVVCSTSTRPINSFPSLVVLTVHNCPELETFTNQSIDFPSLEKLEIEGIKSGGQLGEILCKIISLKLLTIKDVEKGLKSVVLAEICRNNQNLFSVYINNVGELESMDDSNSLCVGSGSNTSSVAASQSSKALLSLSVFGCPKLRYMDVQSLTGLRTLGITNCSSLEYITRDSSNSLKGLTSLETLGIKRCSSLISIPDLQDCPALSVLRISECEKVSSISPDQFGCLPKLKTLELGPFGGELEYFPGFGAEQQQQELFLSLERVELKGWGSKPESLPDQLQYATKVEHLGIHDCHGLKELPGWIGNLSSLHSLELFNCKSLTTLEVTAGLTNFRYLEVSGCPELEKRYKNKDGRAWLKQARIESNLA